MDNKIELVWKSVKDGSVTDTVTLYEYGNYIVENVEGGYAIVKYTGDEADIIIPESINGLPVVRLGNDSSRLTGRYTYVFESNQKIKTLVIPASVAKIKGFSLQNCYPEAFYVHENNKNFSSRKGVLFDKQKKELIRYPAGCTKKSYFVPENIEKIGYSAFRDCESLESIILPDELKEICWEAFAKCNSLKSIVIPESIGVIDWHVFEDCESLDSVVFPSRIEKLGSHAFSNCKSLRTINIPNSVIRMDGSVFAGCSSLNSVHMPNNYVITGDGMFSGCCNLKSFSVDSNNVSFSVDDGVLFNEDKTILIQFPAGKDVKEYTIPGFVIEINDSAFRGCGKLTKISIPESVKKVGWFVFSDCENLTDINIPKGTDFIAYNSFSGCRALINITVDVDDQMFSIEDGVLFNKEKSTLICYPGGIKRDNYIIPEGVTKIMPEAFRFFAGCLTLPGSMTKVIGGGIMTGNVFRLCNEIKKVVIPSSVTEIEEFAFIQCDSLEAVEIHAKKENIKIGEAAFHDRTSINFVHCRDDTQ